MQIKNKLVLLLCSSLCLLNISLMKAQDIKLAGFNYTRFPNAPLVNSPINQEVQINEYSFFVNIPKPLKNQKTVLVNGLQYKLVTPFLQNDAALGIDGQDFHIIGYQFLALHKLKNNWAVLGVLNPILSSTLSTDLGQDDLLVNGTLQFMKQQSERFSYGGGLLFTSRFGNPQLFPALMVTAQTPKSRFRAFLPQEITYDRYYGKLTVGLQAVVDGSLYNVDLLVDNGGGNVEPVDKVAYTRIVIGLTLSYRLGKMLQIQAAGGITASRSVELESDFFDTQTSEVENGAPFFRVGIALVPPRKDKE